MEPMTSDCFGLYLEERRFRKIVMATERNGIRSSANSVLASRGFVRFLVIRIDILSWKYLY